MAKQLELSDGRSLDYAIGGASEGFPLIWCHGTPSGYTAIPALERACDKQGFKLVTFSRAGYGGSSRRQNRRIVDVVDDVRALLKHLGHKECVVGGWSGGDPHALACAAKLEGCLAAIAVAAVAPYNVEGLDWLAGQGQDNIEEHEAALKGEEVLANFCEDRRPEMIKGTAANIAELMASLLPEVDRRALLDSDDLAQYLGATMKEGLKNSANGWVDDTLSFLEPWGFDVADVKCPVSLYQGHLDLMVPSAHGQWLASHIPQNCLKKHIYIGEGHISIFLGRIEQMLDEMKEAIGDEA